MSACDALRALDGDARLALLAGGWLVALAMVCGWLLAIAIGRAIDIVRPDPVAALLRRASHDGDPT